MARGVAVIAWVVVAASLAGCGKAEETCLDCGGFPDATREFDGATGSVRGTITDTEGIPVPGALVGIVDVGQMAADETGGFLFAYVPVGERRLQAAALGYASAERAVTVVADQESLADLQLGRLAVDEPYHETVVKAGHVCFQLNVAGQLGENGVTLNGGNAACGATGNIFQPFDVRPGLKTLVAEMEWVPTSGVTAPEFRLAIWQGGARSGVFSCEFCYGETRGPSPIMLRIDEGTLVGEHEPFAGVTDDASTLDDVIFTPPSNGNPAMVNVVVDQRTTIHNTMFYGARAPEGFTALEQA